MKRIEALVPLSREHHHTLLLVWKIRQGLKKGIATARMAAYALFFYRSGLSFHFDEEERSLFTLLAEDDHMRIKAFADHAQLRQELLHMEHDACSEAQLIQFIDSLEAHVRFEERELFPYIQDMSLDGSIILVAPEQHVDMVTLDEMWEDHFWK